jgi:hypothetical protein
MQKRILFLILTALMSLTLLLGASAQDIGPGGASSCPKLVSEAFNATDLICEDLGANELCYGNGTFEATPANPDAAINFDTTGDRISLGSLASIVLRSVTAEDQLWTVGRMRLALPTTDALPAEVTALVFGDMSLAIETERPQSAGAVLSGTVIGGRGLLVRRGPDASYTQIWQMAPGDTALVTGRSGDNAWYRIEVPSYYGGIGWVYGMYMELNGDAGLLPFVDIDSPAPVIESTNTAPERTLLLRTRLTDPACAETPHGGLLAQTPSGVAQSVVLEVNGARVALNGTAFLYTAGDTLVLVALEGETTLTSDETGVALRAGEQSTLTLDETGRASGTPSAAEPVTDPALAFLPLDSLPRPFAPPIADAGGPSSIPTPLATAAGPADPAPLPTPVPEATASVDAGPAQAGCVLTNNNAVPIGFRAGPDSSFGIAGNLEPDAQIVADGRGTDSAQYIWYRTEIGWVRFDTVTTTAACGNLPLVAENAGAAGPAGAGTASLVSSTLGELCGAGQATVVATASSGDPFATAGGTWQASAGTRATFVSTGDTVAEGPGTDAIRLVTPDGAVLAVSGPSQVLTHTFPDDAGFVIELAFGSGPVPSLSIQCER